MKRFHCFDLRFFFFLLFAVTNGGQATYEEMCFGYLLYYPRVPAFSSFCVSQEVPETNGLLHMPLCAGLSPVDYREAIQFEALPVVSRNDVIPTNVLCCCFFIITCVVVDILLFTSRFCLPFSSVTSSVPLLIITSPHSHRPIHLPAYSSLLMILEESTTSGTPEYVRFSPHRTLMLCGRTTPIPVSEKRFIWTADRGRLTKQTNIRLCHKYDCA